MFPFGFSFQEALYLGVFLTVAGGYRETFMRMSRNGGVFVGRAVASIRQKREQVFASSVQRREMQSLQQQMSDAMSELHSIRHNIRSTTSLRSTPSAAASSSAGVSASAADATETPNASGGSSAQGHAPNAHAQDAPSSHATGLDLADPAQLAAAPEQAGAHATHATHCSGHAAGSAASAQQRYQQLQVEDPSGRTVYIAGVPLIPVTAAASGRGARQRAGPQTGADIAEEALLEQEVARRAAQLLQGNGLAS